MREHRAALPKVVCEIIRQDRANPDMPFAEIAAIATLTPCLNCAKLKIKACGSDVRNAQPTDTWLSCHDFEWVPSLYSAFRKAQTHHSFGWVAKPGWTDPKAAWTPKHDQLYFGELDRLAGNPFLIATVTAEGEPKVIGPARALQNRIRGVTLNMAFMEAMRQARAGASKPRGTCEEWVVTLNELRVEHNYEFGMVSEALGMRKE